MYLIWIETSQQVQSGSALQTCAGTYSPCIVRLYGQVDWDIYSIYLICAIWF